MPTWSIVPSPPDTALGQLRYPVSPGVYSRRGSDAQLRPEEEVESWRGEPFPLLVVAVQQVLDPHRQGDLADLRPGGLPGVPRVSVHDRVPGPTSGEKVRGPELVLVALEPPVELGL